MQNMMIHLLTCMCSELQMMTRGLEHGTQLTMANRTAGFWQTLQTTIYDFSNYNSPKRWSHARIYCIHKTIQPKQLTTPGVTLIYQLKKLLNAY